MAEDEMEGVEVVHGSDGGDRGLGRNDIAVLAAMGVATKPRSRRRQSIAEAMTKENLFHASSKDFVKRIYRSDKALENEQLRQKQFQHFVIHPFSTFRWYWDLWMVFLMSITLILLPVNIAFYSDQFSVHWTTVNCFTDSFFLIDIILNFVTGIVDHKNEDVILLRKRIALKYIRTWFFPDFISSFPFDYIYIFIQGTTDYQSSSTALTLRVFRLAKILGILRLLRLARLMRYINKLEEILNIEGAVIRIVNLTLLMIVVAHWNGCIQFFIAFAQDFPTDSWVTISNLQDANKWQQYSWSFFKAICHMLGIGFGRHVPQNLIEMWAATISIMLGATFYALFVGQMATLLLSIDASGRIYNEKINQVKEYMRYRKIPASTQKRVLTYYEHRYQRKYFDEDTILREQNEPLRREITQHRLQSLVQKVDFLNKGSADFVLDVIEKLTFEVYLKNDVIIKAGRHGDAMYFIEHGMVNIEVEGRIVGTLQDGDHFGEIALLISERRVASVIAKTTCDIYRLHSSDFDDVLEEYPEMRAIMTEVADERLQKITESSRAAANRKTEEFRTTKKF
ncbi:potassium/sodium hyperpolarization-activated cyclic nucleotide-gated channel 2-like [Acanthaster planci]|uniref:Potassium/sodium hyperpolarization-activated cyclic nucleotide-gated channel 2-like n=1 Tax=Acanthaster planci TaxID=133434 RepID=A0A8B7ZUT7_ACAPL|nr:potassium/sodium hyperpolarization-activated cyclic nucleotide-gated channel 2-like [Acanthaster planci]